MTAKGSSRCASCKVPRRGIAIIGVIADTNDQQLVPREVALFHEHEL